MAVWDLNSSSPEPLVIHIEHICTFFVAFFSATIDGRNLIFRHKLHIGTPYRGKRFLTRQIPTSYLPKSGGIISEHELTVHLVFTSFNCIDYSNLEHYVTKLED
jgi:hypothetical protein